jgi:hypothetical protein
LCATAVGLGGCFANTTFQLLEIDDFIARAPPGISLLVDNELRRFYIVGLVGQVISLFSIVSGLREGVLPGGWGESNYCSLALH